MSGAKANRHLILHSPAATIRASLQARRPTIFALIVLLFIDVAMFAEILLSRGTRVLGHPGSDLFLQYFSWREFGFRELARGNLALWNPHIFSGAPYFGGMQGAQLYPPNWLFLILPTAAAVNWTVAFHVYLIAVFTFCWMRQRELRVLSSFFAGTLVMFSGAFFPHVFAGHLPQMNAMTWSPLIFCSIEAVLRTERPQWSLLGMFAVAMQILAGFPQYVFYTAIIAALYVGLRLISRWNARVVLAFVGMYMGGALLAAVQLLPAIQTTVETTRGLRLPFEFASMLAFPPENFATLLAPNFFGELPSYWGRWYLWETSLFISASGVVLAVYGAIAWRREGTWIPLVLIFISLLFALGVYTPLFRFLYSWVPGFDRFRSISKFIFPGSLFLVLLAATGFDRLLVRKRAPAALIASIFGGSALLAVAACFIGTTQSWSALMNHSRVTGESYLFPQLYSSAEFIAQSQHRAAMSVGFAAVALALLGIILLLARRNSRFLFAVAGLALIEMFIFAHGTLASFDSTTIVNSEKKKFLQEHSGDYRIMDITNPDTAMIMGAQDIWGYDATVVRRYAEFMTWTQGGDPNKSMSYVKFTRFDPLFAMLRNRYVFAQRGTEVESAEAPVSPMPHLQLISNYQVVQDRDAIFNAMHAATFDPAREAILESEPEPRPMGGDVTGSAHITGSSTDSLTIEADVDRATILLVTDAYTSSWRAVPLPGSAQQKYQLLAANYVLRAVPLAAGHHLLRIEYSSAAFVAGVWISLAACLGFVATFVVFRKYEPSS